MLNEPISSIMTPNPITLGPKDTLGQAREIFMQKKVHHLPIVDGEKLVGMVTSWDIFKLGKSVEEYNSMPIDHVMTKKLATLNPDDHIGAAAEVLMEHLFHAIPIIDDDHILKGIVTTYDLLKLEFKKEYPEDLSRFIPENM